MALIKTAPMLPREWISAAGVCVYASWWTHLDDFSRFGGCEAEINLNM